MKGRITAPVLEAEKAEFGEEAMSPPRGRMPITRNEWVLYWTFWAVAPAIGWALIGKDGAVTYGRLRGL